MNADPLVQLVVKVAARGVFKRTGTLRPDGIIVLPAHLSPPVNTLTISIGNVDLAAEPRLPEVDFYAGIVDTNRPIGEYFDAVKKALGPEALATIRFLRVPGGGIQIWAERPAATVSHT